MKCRIGSPSRREPRRPVRQEALVLLLADREAEVRPVARGSGRTRGTAARRASPRGLPARASVTPSPTALDDAGALVAEHRRRVAGRVGAGGRVEVGVADAAGDEPDEHLARLRLGEVDLLDDERLPELLENRGPDTHRPMLAEPLTRRSRSRRAGRGRLLRLEHATHPRVEVQVCGGDRDERHRERVHDSGHDVEQDERRLGEDDQQGADERADRERNTRPIPTERRRGTSARGRAPRCGARLRAPRRSSGSTTCARNAHRTASQSATGLRKTVAVSTTQAPTPISRVRNNGRKCER